MGEDSNSFLHKTQHLHYLMYIGFTVKPLRCSDTYKLLPGGWLIDENYAASVKGGMSCNNSHCHQTICVIESELDKPVFFWRGRISSFNGPLFSHNNYMKCLEQFLVPLTIILHFYIICRIGLKKHPRLVKNFIAWSCLHRYLNVEKITYSEASLTTCKYLDAIHTFNFKLKC